MIEHLILSLYRTEQFKYNYKYKGIIAISDEDNIVHECIKSKGLCKGKWHKVRLQIRKGE